MTEATKPDMSVKKSTDFKILRQWIASHVEDSDQDHDAIKKQFDKKFAKGDKKLLAYFDKVVDSIVL
jgi:hypothetical protein